MHRCYGGTWRIVEVTDYKPFLQRLCDKCDRIIATAKVGEYGEPSQEAVDFLTNSVLTPARELLGGTVSEEQYMTYANLYQQFLDMPRASLLDAISEQYYYRIRNAYFTDRFASLNASTKNVEPKTSGTTDNYLWAFKKNADGTVSIFNKSGLGRATYVGSSAADQVVKSGSNYNWTLMEVTTDQNHTGIAIVDKSGQYSWYTNPSAFANVILKPYNWGASIWTLERQDIDVPTGIHGVAADGEPTQYYDLSGRRVQQPERGIYVTDRHTKVLK